MRVRIRYAGRVQGVGFRATACAIACREPVTGWVRNESDGSVLMEVQGAAADVERVLAGIRSTMGRNIQSEDAAAIADVSGEPEFEVHR